MADPYLTKAEAVTRLEAFNITTASANLVTDADLRIASNDLDERAPFLGERPYDQERQFPRLDPETDEAELSVPDEILDWVALRAHSLATNEVPAVRSEGAGRVSVSYFSPKPGPNARRMASMLAPYLRKTGTTGERRRNYSPRPDPYPKRGI